MKAIIYIALLLVLSLKVFALPVSEIDQLMGTEFNGLYVGLLCRECSVTLTQNDQDLLIQYNRGCFRKTTYTIRDGLAVLEDLPTPGTWVPTTASFYDEEKDQEIEVVFTRYRIHGRKAVDMKWFRLMDDGDATSSCYYMNR